MPLFALTIFASAFLLFLVQPIVAKQILPWFGGSAAVWATCLVFFQTDAAAGLRVRRLRRCARSRRARRCKLHVALLVVSLVALPIVPGAFWKPDRRREADLPHPRPARAAPSAFRTSCCRRRARCCRRGSRAASRAAIRIACSRCRTSPRCWRCSAIRSCSSRGSPRACRPGAGRPATRSSSALAAAAALASLKGASGAPVALAPGGRRRGRRAAADGRAPGALVHARRDRLGAAARGQQPHHAERRGGAAPVDRAAARSTSSPSSSASTARAGTGATSSSRCCPPRSASWRGRSPTRPSRTTSRSRSRVFCVGLFLACMFCHGELVRLSPRPPTSRASISWCRWAARSGRRSSASSRRWCCRPTSSSPACSSCARCCCCWQARREPMVYPVLAIAALVVDRRLRGLERHRVLRQRRSSPRATSTACCACRKPATT